MERLLLCATIFLFINQLLHVTAVQSYPVRLTGGSNVYGGLVEVLYNSTWRTVCTTDWGVDEALVTCRQLGIINSTAAEPTFNNLVVSNTDSNAVTISCTDSEYIALEDCNVTFTTSCGSDRIEVQCSSPPQRPSFNEPLFDTTGTIATIRWTISTAGNSQPAANYQVTCSSVNAPHNITHLVSSNNIVLHGLNSCALYTCCVGGIDTNGAIGAVDCTSFRTPFSPVVGSPTGLEYIELQSRSVTLRWEQLNTAERCSPPILYSVRVVAGQQQQQQGLCNGQQLMESNTTNTHAIITGLCPYSRYSISIKACTEHGDVCGSYSSSLSVRTLEDVPTNVNNLRCRALNPTQVNIEWQPPTQTNGVIQFYNIILNNINTTQNTTKYVESNTTTTIINHLHPNHHYSCSIAVYSAAGRNVSAIQNVVLEGSSPTGVPEEFNCSQSSSTSLQLNWREPNPLEQNGPIENYSVIVWNLDTNEVVYSNFTSFISLTIHSLVSYHNYKCAVAANGQFGLGPFDDKQVWISSTDHNFGPPLNLQVDRVTSRSFRVTWSEPSVRYNTTVHINNYEVTVFGYQERTTISSLTRTFTDPAEYEQRFLHPNYRYRIELSAAVAGVPGPTADYIIIQTSEDAPTGAPESLSYANVTTSSFTLTWNVPPLEQQNGEIIGYMVNVTLHNSRSDEPSQVTTANVTARSFIATYLSQDTSYNATVAAMTSVGIGPPTLPVSIKTMKLAPPLIINKIESDNSVIIALPVLSVVLVVIIILLIMVSLRLCCRIQKIEKTYKFQGSEVVQLQDCRQVNSSTYVIENAPPVHDIITEPTSCEHTEASNTYTSTEEKKIKPPAVPPKTYLEPKSDTNGEIETPSDEGAQSVDDGDNVDTCSVGSDSLYDMKLEKIGFQMPQRAASVTIQSAQAIIIPPRNLPRVRATSIGSLKLSKCEQVQVAMDHETEQKNHGGSKESDYQKLDVKKMAPLQQYASLPGKRRINKEPAEGQNYASRVPGHGQESHYEPLRLKSVSKPSNHLYQELKFIRT